MDAEALQAYLGKSLDVSKRGSDDALKGEPASDTKDLSAAENEIIGQVRAEATRRLDDFDRRIEGIERECEKIREHNGEQRREIESISGQRPPTSAGHEQVKKDLETAQAHLNHFKQENRLMRKARTLDSRFLAFSLVVLVAVVEGVVNSFFFSLASDFGLLGGFFQAFFVSVVNIGFALLAGFFSLREMAHIKPLRKLAGAVSLFLSLAVVAAINLTAAQYRGLLEQGAENPERLAAERLLAADFAGALNSLNSVLLILIGLMCAIFALWKGFRLDDPYPGYGDAQREVDLAREKLLDYADDAEDDRDQWRDSKFERLNAIRSELEEERVRVVSFRTSCSLLRQSVGEYSGETLSAVAQRLLSRYRDENRKIRASPPPAHFSEYPSADAFESASMYKRIGENESRLSKLGAEFETLSAEADALLKLADSAKVRVRDC